MRFILFILFYATDVALQVLYDININFLNLVDVQVAVLVVYIEISDPDFLGGKGNIAKTK